MTKKIFLYMLLLGAITAKAGPYAVLDLFAGVGGLSYGFSKYDEFEILAANEIDADIAEAYKANHPRVSMLVCGIQSLEPRMLEEACRGRKIDVVVGGPPCQSYSTAGKREIDDRANLFKEYKRVLEILKPRSFIFENVRGLLSMDGGAFFPRIQEEFKASGYQLCYKVLDAADYGVPQHRKRVILVGFKGKNPFVYPEPTHGEGRVPWVTLEDALGDLPQIKSGESEDHYASRPVNAYQSIMRANVGDLLTEHKSPKNAEHIVKIMETLKEGQDKFDLPEAIRPGGGFANTYGKLWWNRPAGTITRNFGTPSSARCIHPRDSRALTIREGARLQSFPDDFVFVGSDGKKRLEIGNAVPPLLARALAGAMLKALHIVDDELRTK